MWTYDGEPVHAESPDFAAAIAAVDRLAESGEPPLGPRDIKTLGEVARRLQRLAADAVKLIELNNRLVDFDAISRDFDSDTDTLVFRAGEAAMAVQLIRGDPDTPLTVTHAVSGGAYDAAHDAREPSAQASVRRELETSVEAYYVSAHRVLKLLATVPGLKKMSCKEVIIVRNKLVEHPSRGGIYSFGYGSTGPRIKPMQTRPVEWNDDGLVPNTRAFVKTIEAAIARIVPPAT